MATKKNVKQEAAKDDTQTEVTMELTTPFKEKVEAVSAGWGNDEKEKLRRFCLYYAHIPKEDLHDSLEFAMTEFAQRITSSGELHFYGVPLAALLQVTSELVREMEPGTGQGDGDAQTQAD